MNVTTFSTEMLCKLSDHARSSSRKRLHHNIHQSYDEACQRLLNAIDTESYIRPHRHSIDPKTETLFAIRGKFALVIFDDSGVPQQLISFGAADCAPLLNAGVELLPGCWHTVLALTSGAVLLEVKAGPFREDGAKEFAPWAPEEGSENAAAYFSRLKKLAGEAA